MATRKFDRNHTGTRTLVYPRMKKRNLTQKQGALSLNLLSSDTIDLARHETNLLVIGFFAANDSRHGDPVTRREIVLEVPTDGRRVERTVVLEAPPRLGLPSTADRDKFLAFTKIALEQRARDGMLTNPIRFSGYRMAQELGFVVGGGLYSDIYAWGQRMANTTISSHGVIYRKGAKSYLDTTEHVFRKFRRAGVEKGKNVSQTFEVTAEDWLLENLNEMYVVREDWNAYKSLTRPTAKGLFGYLHVWFRASKGNPVERSYSSICNRLNVPEYKFPSKIKETIGQALDELVAIGYLSSWSLARMVSNSGAFKLVLSPGNELLKILKITEKSLQSGSDTPVITIEESPVVTELTAMGVTRAKAKELLKLGTEEQMLHRIEYVRSLILKKDGELENPAGFAISLLEKGVEVPASFITSKQREEIIAAQRKEREEQDRQILTDLAYSQWCEDQVEAVIAARYTEEALEEILKARLPAVISELPQLRNVEPKRRLHVVRQLFKKEIRSELDLPSLEQWSEMDEYKDVNVSLFVN
jgi:hypothetical protein